MDRKILIIPHHPDFRKIKIRLAELARCLSKQHKVYLLDWHSALANNCAFGRIEAGFKDLFRSSGVCSEGAMGVVRFPMLHRPIFCAPVFNTFWLERMVRTLGIDVVVNGSYYLFSIPQKRQYKYILDLADVPVSGNRSVFDAFIERSVKGEIAKSDKVTVSSNGLVDYVSSTYGVTAQFVPNGADLEIFKRVAQDEVATLRRKYGLENKWVIGFIGYFGDWVDIEFLVEVFSEVKKSVPNSVLFIVGSSDRLRDHKRQWASGDIIFTGQVDPRHIESYFLACDVGVLPNKRSVFQDMAFHIKLIEFGAAQKLVVASDLEEVTKMNLPNVRIVPLVQADWVRALLEIKGVSWQGEWAKDLYLFDWKNIAGEFSKMLEAL